jgi:hypothetical protein
MIDTEKMGSHTTMASTIRDAAERFGRETRPPEREGMHEMGEFYEQAGNWLQDNYGKAIAVVGVAAIAGVVGYMMGRNAQMHGTEITHHS